MNDAPVGQRLHVWDKARGIKFVAPGRQHVYAHFKLEPHVVNQLSVDAAGGGKLLHWFETDVVNA